MKLEALTFDDTVTIFQGKDVGGGLSRQDLRDSSFRAADGWSLLRTSPGVYSIHRDGMPKAVCVEGYGSSYVEAYPTQDDIARMEAASSAAGRAERKGKR